MNVLILVAAIVSISVFPAESRAQTEGSGAGLAMPYLTTLTGDFSVLTVSNVSPQAIALRVVAIESAGAFDAVSFACPLEAGQTTDLVFRQQPLSLPGVEARCAILGATPPEATSETISRDLIAATGLVWIAVEDPVTGETLALEALQGRADLYLNLLGQMYTLPPVSFQGGINDGDRRYEFDGLEYSRFAGAESTHFPRVVLPGARPSLLLGTLDATVGAGAPSANTVLDWWDIDGVNRNAAYTFLGLVNTPIQAIDGQLETLALGTRGRLELAPISFPTGERVPILGWILTAYDAGVALTTPGFTTPGASATGRALRRSNTSFTPEPSGEVTLVALGDGDGDGIEDPIDTAPTVFSNDFDDTGLGGMTTGTVIDRAGQILTIDDAAAPLGVRMRADSSGPATEAEIEVCGGIVTAMLGPADSFLATCTSAALTTLAGVPTYLFELGGVPFEATPPPGQGIVVDPDAGTVGPAPENTEPVEVTGAATLVLEPGSEPVEATSVAIDVVPFRHKNKFNNRSRIPIGVAVLSGPGVDATALDPETFHLGPGMAAPLRWRGRVIALDIDVDRDGERDLLVFFRPRETGYGRGVQPVCLQGALSESTDFVACEVVRVTGAR